MKQIHLIASLLVAAAVFGCATDSGQPLPPRVPTAAVAPPPPAVAQKGTLPPSQASGEVDRLFAAKLAQLRESARELGQPLALYEDDPTGGRALLAKRAQELDANEATVVEDWKKRVDADPDARAQFVAAQDAYEATTGDDGDQAAGASQKGDTTIIYAEPSYAFTNYV